MLNIEGKLLKVGVADSCVAGRVRTIPVISVGEDRRTVSREKEERVCVDLGRVGRADKHSSTSISPRFEA